jgi:hypothetical protein
MQMNPKLQQIMTMHPGGSQPPQGAPQQAAGIQPPGQTGEPIPADKIEAEIQRFASQNPQAVQQIQSEIMQAMQSGELTPQELNMVVQLATTALQNPQMYPKVRQFAIQQGIATEQDIPAEYDQGLLIALVIAGKVMQGAGNQSVVQGGPQQSGPQQVPAQAGMQPFKQGGALPDKSANPDGSIPIKAHEGEFVIPAHVVKAKGTDFFDALVEKYNPDSDKNSA